ncbi:hypothetical protein PanWU01x14_191440, partial [Parasponia andersonii]
MHPFDLDSPDMVTLSPLGDDRAHLVEPQLDMSNINEDLRVLRAHTRAKEGVVRVHREATRALSNQGIHSPF